MPYKTEHGEQAAFVDWCLVQINQGAYPDLFYGYAVPNGGKRDKRTAAKMVAEGTHRGVPDWHLPVARGKFHGFWIEFKVGRNDLSDDQRDYIGFLARHGHKVVVAYSFEMARDALVEYLK